MSVRRPSPDERINQWFRDYYVSLDSGAGAREALVQVVKDAIADAFETCARICELFNSAHCNSAADEIRRQPEARQADEACDPEEA